jgi:zinc transporter ZupT
MLFLVAALAAPVIGPVLYGGLHGHPKAVRLVDGFVYLAVPLLVAWQIVPFAWEDRSLLVPLVVVAGVLLPSLCERASHAFEAHTDNFAIIVGLSGLALHALLEGAAFGPGGTVGTAFGLAVILHRIPVSLVIWWLIRPRHGTWAAVAGVATIVLATLVGYLLAAGMDSGQHGIGVEYYQAFVSGTLMHVVFHQGRHDHRHHEHRGRR